MSEPDQPASQTAPVTVVLVPVKRLARAKSRLVQLSAARRRDLAEAFARDTVSAALRTPGVHAVLVVTDDRSVAAKLCADAPSDRCVVVPDGAPGDLNATLVQAADDAARRWPGCRAVALCADLPALRPEDLASAIVMLAGIEGAAYLRDALGTGTTLYAAPPALFTPRFGPGSAHTHAEDGTTELGEGMTDRWASLRRDVDVLADLTAAVALGVGDHTARVLDATRS